MRRAVLWFAVSAVLIGAVASLVGLARRSASGTLTPEFSARRYDPYGLAALDAVLRERGTPVGWLQRPRLPDEFTGTLLQVTPNQSERIDVWALADGGEAVYQIPLPRLIRWVASGNRLVHVTRHVTPLLRTLDIGVTTDDGLGDVERLFEDQAAGLPPDRLDPPTRVTGADGRALRLRHPARFTLPDAPAAGPLRPGDPAAVLVEAGGLGEPVNLAEGGVAVRVPLGDGEVVLVGAPTPFTNEGLPRGDHLAFVLDALGVAEDTNRGRAVLIDEWAHGLGHSGTLLETAVRLGLLPVLIQVPVLLLGYAWYRSRRPVPEPEQEDADEASGSEAAAEAELLATLYRGGLPPGDAAVRVAGEVRRRLAARHRVSPGRLREVLRRRSDPEAAAALRLLDEASDLAGRGVPRCGACGYPVDLRAERDPSRCSECGAALAASTLRRVAVLRAGSAEGVEATPDEARQKPAGWGALRGMLARSARG